MTDTDALARAIAGEDEPELGIGDCAIGPDAADLAEFEEPVSTELALPNGTIIDTSDLAQVLQAIKDLDMLKAMVASARRKLTDLIMDERKRTGSAATLHRGSHTAEIKVTREIVWDMEILAELHEAGLPEETWNELVVETVSTKVDARVANRIAQANEEYDRIISAARTDHEKNPSVTVK